MNRCIVFKERKRTGVVFKERKRIALKVNYHKDTVLIPLHLWMLED